MHSFWLGMVVNGKQLEPRMSAGYAHPASLGGGCERHVWHATRCDHSLYLVCLRHTPAAMAGVRIRQVVAGGTCWQELRTGA